MKTLYKIGLIYCVIMLSACTTLGFDDLQDGELNDGYVDSADDDLESMALDEDCKPPCAFPRTAIEDPNSELMGRLIFFNFDSAEIQDKYQDLLVAHGKYLASYPDVKLRLEGHTDERGSREYNLALGEERAKSVRRLLLLQGANDSSINVVSFGEEIPMDLGHDESAWGQNRRVELVYEE